MRIIAGEWKGVPIQAPQGLNTRPTVERVRESLMSSLFSILNGFDGIVALDAFAGSGALGLEALSRGAEQAWFYEYNPGSRQTLLQNIAKVKCDASRAVVRQDDIFLKPPVTGHQPFGLVMLDPPYAYSPADVLALLEQLDAAQMLADYVTISYEHAKDTDISGALAQSRVAWGMISQKTFGDTTIDIFGKEEA